MNPLTQEEINDIKSILNDPQFQKEDEHFRASQESASLFLDLIYTGPVSLIIEAPKEWTTKNPKVQLYFFGKQPTCPLEGLSYDSDKASEQCVTCDVGQAFNASYHQLIACTKMVPNFVADNSCIDDIYLCLSDLRIMNTIIEFLHDGSKVPSDLADRLSLLCQSDMRPFYGKRTLKDNVYKTLQKYVNCDHPDNSELVRHMYGQIRYEYSCDNLFQICGALLDYLCHYKKSVKSSKSEASERETPETSESSDSSKYIPRPQSFSLKRCPRCGSFFITNDRRIKYCSYSSFDGQKCAALQEADRKRALASAEKSDSEQLAEKIRRRLYQSYIRIGDSSPKGNQDPCYQERKDLYDLYMKCRKKHSKSPSFDTWIAECAAKLPNSRNESYDKFKEWLQERS